MSRPAVFLDRDGVLNAAVVRESKPYPPASIEEMEILPGVEEALRALREAGYALVCITNQPDVARGTADKAVVDSMNAFVSERLGLEGMYACYHDEADACDCRKPKPGLILRAAAELDLDLGRSWMVGDRWKDIDAGRNAGCRTFFIDYGYAEKRPSGYDYAVGSLREATDILLKGRTRMKTLEQLRVKIFADGADLAGMLEMYEKPYIKGLTTNPTLMKKAGITDYKAFAKQAVAKMPKKPLSFEVFSDEFSEMERQAMEITTWGENVYVKIPVTNTKRQSSCPLIKRLADRGVKMNITAMMTLKQVLEVVESLNPKVPSFVSVFAGRIADTGRDPVPLMAAAVELLKINPAAELIWASPRELLNIVQADDVGCHIITATNDILKKIPNMGKDLDEYSLDTVKMFYNDATAAGFKL